jgi:catalase
VAHLLNIHPDLAQRVADGLRLKEMPAPAQAARPTRTDLQPSDALSILKNGPQSFKGRKLGILVTDGVDATLFNALTQAVKDAGATFEVIAPMIGGVQASDGTWIEAQQKLNGGPSVLYDAVALLLSEAGAQLLAQEATARDFVADAFAHAKFIGYTQPSLTLFDKAGIRQSMDKACVSLGAASDAARFIAACGALRLWERESKVNVI